jgi:hypothetical protein
MRVPTGHNSPRTDERCFTYCSQTVAGRHRGRAPTCKSICFRRVFAHEVKKLVARTNAPDGRTITTAGAVLSVPQVVEERPKQIPLPEEGQDPTALFSRWMGSPGVTAGLLSTPAVAPRPQSAAAARKESKRSEKNGTDKAAKEGPKETKYWEEGWYVWYTNSKWHALDHTNMMMFSLERQAGWDHYRARMRSEWIHRYNELMSGAAYSARKAGVQRRQEKEEATAPAPATRYVDVTEPLPNEFHPGRVRGPLGTNIGVPMYPSLSGRALLLPLPPPIPSITTAVENLLKPTQKVFEIVHRTWESGAQRQFAEKLWSKSVGPEWREPWRLLGRAWETVMNRPSDSDDDD